MTLDLNKLRYRLWIQKKRLHKIFKMLVSILPNSLQLRHLKLVEFYKQHVTNRRQIACGYNEYIYIQKSLSVNTREHWAAKESAERCARILLEYLQDKSLILDAGCGDGFAQDIFRQAGHISIGFDLNLAKLSVSQQHEHYVAACDLHYLPLCDASVNAVHCSHVLEHMLDAPRFLKELKRIAKIEGRLVFAVPLGPGNKKHPTAFITESDALGLVSRFFGIQDHLVSVARGHFELVIVAEN